LEPFDLYSRGIDANPFPGYQRLRDDHPCYWSEEAGLWILSRYGDVQAAALDWQTFSSLRGNLVDEIPGRSGGTLGTTDPPHHDRLRQLAQAAFTRKALEQLSGPAAEIADAAIDQIEGSEVFDFVGDFSSIVTVGTIFRMLGLPERDPTETRKQVVLSISTDKAARGRNAELNQAFTGLTEFLSSEIAQRRANPADDLITALAEAEIEGERLTEREVMLTTTMFVVAGVESLSSFMSIFALNLAEHEVARRRLAADPDLTLAAIEESLRFNTSAQRFKRTATRDVELYGKTIAAGDTVVLAYGAANRDGRKFPNPDVYDIDRNPRGHLGFGSGKHFCIGSNFARMVAKTAMDRLLARIPEFEVADQNFDWIPSSNFRSPVTLPLKIL
jgi:hypothetical protein